MENELVYNKDGSLLSASGPDAVNLCRCGVLIVSLGLLVSSGGRIQPTRGFTLTKGLSMASGYTGKTYKRKDAAQAVEDLRAWKNAMQAALPQRTVGEG